MKSIIILVQCLLLFIGLVMALPPFVGQLGALTQEAPDGNEAVDTSASTNVQAAQEVAYYKGNPNPIPVPFGTCVPVFNDQNQPIEKAQFKEPAFCYFYDDRDCCQSKAPVPILLPSGVDLPNFLDLAKYVTKAYECTNAKGLPLVDHFTNPDKFGISPEHLVMALSPPKTPKPACTPGAETSGGVKPGAAKPAEPPAAAEQPAAEP